MNFNWNLEYSFNSFPHQSFFEKTPDRLGGKETFTWKMLLRRNIGRNRFPPTFLQLIHQTSYVTALVWAIQPWGGLEVHCCQQLNRVQRIHDLTHPRVSHCLRDTADAWDLTDQLTADYIYQVDDGPDLCLSLFASKNVGTIARLWDGECHNLAISALLFRSII